MGSLSRRERRLLRRFGTKHDELQGTNPEKKGPREHAQVEENVGGVGEPRAMPKGFSGKILHIYDKNYKQLLLIPMLLLFICFGIIGYHWVTTGNFIEKGISLSGGSTLTIQKAEAVDIAAIKSLLRGQFPSEDINVRALSKAGKRLGIIVETTATDQKQVQLITATLKRELAVKTVTVETIGPALGESFFKEAIYAVLLAFVFMAIVVFLYFRSPVPSSYVVLAAFSDIVFAWAMVIMFNIKLSTAGVAAFLMLVGYSVDTDILLTTRVLKREGATFSKIIDAFSTGIVMTLAAIAATSIAYLTTPSETLKQIMLILFWGLVADIIFTWVQNACLLRWYVELKNKKHAAGTPH
ncbi:protein translocase subunit SecF [Candidatus Woesearchaeota archaeon]|nr:protein translocase subunit SecF [Candidatus Woesearchaeota archaeon]